MRRLATMTSILFECENIVYKKIIYIKPCQISNYVSLRSLIKFYRPTGFIGAKLRRVTNNF